MKGFFLRSILIVIVVIAVATSQKSQPAFLANSEKTVEGKPLGYWASAWWTWAYGQPAGRDAVRDRTGVFCASNQNGNVWFLAGGYGSSQLVRTCTIPEGKYIFFPLINFFSQFTTRAECKLGALVIKKYMDLVWDQFVELENQRITDSRLLRISSSYCFDIETMSEGTSFSDGYWAMLKPLPKGKYTLKFGGKHPDFSQDIVYKLVIQ